MIFVDNTFGIDKTASLNRIVDMDYNCISLFSSNKLLCINEEILNNKARGKDSILKNQVSISFDLNIISQLKYLKDGSLQDPELDNVIKLCKSGDCAFDSLNYVIENFLKNSNNIGLDSYAIEDIRTFETIFPYKRCSYDRGMPIEKRMEMLMEIWNKEEFKLACLNIFGNLYLLGLANLLCIIHIYFKYAKLSPKHKLEKYLDYCNEELRLFDYCFINLAKMFYDNPQLRFFKKIQKNNKQIIETIENMAWDVFHLKFLGKSVQPAQNDAGIIIIPMFISKDKGLNEIRKAFQVKCLFKNLRTGECFCSYEMNSVNNEYRNKYFNVEDFFRRSNNPRDLKDFVVQLKEKVLEDVKM